MNTQEALDRMAPAAKHAGLGTVLANLIANYNALLADVAAMRTALNTNITVAATLAIKAGGSAIVKTTSQIVAKVAGTVVVKAAATDMSALAGALATAKSAAWAFYVDAAGNITTSTKTADAATDAAAIALLPATPSTKVMVGYVVIANATGADFVGGTTPLDTADLTVTYTNASTTALFSAALTAEALDGLPDY